MSAKATCTGGWARRLGVVLGAAPLALAALSAGCVAEAGDDETVGESSDALLEGRRLSETEVAGHLRTAGFPESEIGRMVCTARYESSLFERASNRNRNGSIDRGLFQINSVHLGSMRGCPTSAEPLFDAATNTRCAYAIWRAQGNRAWYAYRSHRAECDAYQVGGADGAGTADTAGGGAERDSDGGACESATLDRTVPEGTCVQSSANGVWYQCNDGRWYRGGDAARGVFGVCSASHPRS